MTEATILPLRLAKLHLPEGERWPAGMPFPVVAHAVTHRDGVFLFDTGIGTGRPDIDEELSPERVPLPDALAEHGISMADVTAVANCHLHLDHSGQNTGLAVLGGNQVRPASGELILSPAQQTNQRKLIVGEARTASGSVV